jgi:hypothetical protein
MNKLILAGLILIMSSCEKATDPGLVTPKPIPRCGIILNTPTLDSFVYPTYYITTIVCFPEGNEVIHFHDNVTGNHDGSWYLKKYDKDSSYCYFLKAP